MGRTVSDDLKARLREALTPRIEACFAMALAKFIEQGGTVDPGADRDRLFAFFQVGYLNGVLDVDPDAEDD